MGPGPQEVLMHNSVYSTKTEDKNEISLVVAQGEPENYAECMDSHHLIHKIAVLKSRLEC